MAYGLKACSCHPLNQNTTPYGICTLCRLRQAFGVCFRQTQFTYLDLPQPHQVNQLPWDVLVSTRTTQEHPRLPRENLDWHRLWRQRADLCIAGNTECGPFRDEWWENPHDLCQYIVWFCNEIRCLILFLHLLIGKKMPSWNKRLHAIIELFETKMVKTENSSVR